MGSLCDNSGDGDYSVIWEETEPVSRKDYVCCACGGQIKKGEKYAKTSSLYDGRWEHYRNCIVCAEISTYLGKYCFTHKPMPDDLLDHLINPHVKIELLKIYIDNARDRGSIVQDWVMKVYNDPS